MEINALQIVNAVFSSGSVFVRSFFLSLSAYLSLILQRESLHGARIERQSGRRASVWQPWQHTLPPWQLSTGDSLSQGGRTGSFFFVDNVFAVVPKFCSKAKRNFDLGFHDWSLDVVEGFAFVLLSTVLNSCLINYWKVKSKEWKYTIMYKDGSKENSSTLKFFYCLQALEFDLWCSFFICVIYFLSVQFCPASFYMYLLTLCVEWVFTRILNNLV